MDYVDGFLDGLQVDAFVAVLLSNWDKEPVIGVVKDLSANEFRIHHWKGTYKGKWTPQNIPQSNDPWTEMLPKECIVLHSFELTDGMKLLPTTRKHLAKKYLSLKGQYFSAFYVTVSWSERAIVLLLITLIYAKYAIQFSSQHVLTQPCTVRVRLQNSCSHLKLLIRH